VLAQAGVMIEVADDEDAIDTDTIEQEVADFRAFLDTLEPDDFEEPPTSSHS